MSFKSNNVYLTFASFALCLIPIALLTGPFFPDLLLVLIAITYLFKSISEKFHDFFKSKIIIILTIFTIYIVIRSFFSTDPLLSLESSLFYFRYIFFSLAIYYIFSNNLKLVKYFLLITITVILIVIFDSWLQFFTGSNIVGFKKIYVDPGYRVSSFFGNKFILGSYLQKMIIILLPLIYLQDELPSKKKYIFLNLFYILLILTVLITGERASFILIVFSYIIFLLLSNGFRIYRILFLIFFFLSSSIFVYNSETIKPRLLNYTFDQITNFSNTNSNHTYSKIIDSNIIFFSPFHTGHYLTSWNMFKSNPVFGHGTKMFRKLCDDKEYRVIVIKKTEYVDELDGCSTHSHNIYMQLLSETGLFGFAFVFGLFLYLSFCLIKQLFLKIVKRKNFYSNFQITSILSIFILLWPISPHQNFFNNWVCVLYFISFGIFLLSIKKENK